MRRKRLWVLAALVGVLAATQLATPVHAAPPGGDGWFRLYNLATTPERCVVDRSTQEHVRTTGCGTYNDQFFQWVLRYEVSRVPYYNIVNYSTGASIGAASGANNEPIVGSYSFHNLDGFLWTITWNSAGGFYQLRNLNGKCMVARANTDLMVQHSCGNWRDQGFRWAYW